MRADFLFAQFPSTVELVGGEGEFYFVFKNQITC